MPTNPQNPEQPTLNPEPRTPNPPGRPRALDDIKRREVCTLVAAGYDIEGAARFVGCSASTIRREALRNEDFHEQLRQAQLGSQKEPLDAMHKAARTHWRAAAWLLERTGPARFVKREPKRMDLEAVRYLIDQLFEAIAEEIDDQPLRDKIRVKINAVLNNTRLNYWAANTPLRDPKRAQRMLATFRRIDKDEQKRSRFTDDEFRRGGSSDPNLPALPLAIQQNATAQPPLSPSPKAVGDGPDFSVPREEGTDRTLVGTAPFSETRLKPPKTVADCPNPPSLPSAADHRAEEGPKLRLVPIPDPQVDDDGTVLRRPHDENDPSPAQNPASFASQPPLQVRHIPDRPA